MNINEAKQQVKDTVTAYLSTDESGAHRIPLAKQRPLFLLGAPGIGKTAIMAQVAQEMGLGLVSYSMTHHTRQSALGLPRIVHHEYEGLEYEASEYTMSEIVSAVYDYMDRTGLTSGILFLDEINCVSETLYPSMLQFLQFKTFGQHRIPENWVVVCAGNPPEYNRSVHEFDIVTLDRLRKVAIEPELAAWRAYAADHGIHPAVLSFLDVKKDRFYAVESTPEGKAFITARGWEDLSEAMKAHDALELPIDLTLIEQFIQKDDVAEDFALYYELFKKYQSDYRVEDILAGGASEEIRERAREAAFDERLALLGLMLDRLSGDCADALAKEAVVSEVRDTLRELKEPLLEGASLDDTLRPAIASREERLAVAAASDTLSAEGERRARGVILRLKELLQTCMLKEAVAGPEAFDTIHYAYRGFVADLEQSVKAVQTAFDNAFDFVDDVFEDEREGLVFVTELTARQATSDFVSKFNSESYYRHNDGLMVDGHRNVLFTRIDELLADADSRARQATRAPEATPAGTTASIAEAEVETEATVKPEPLEEATPDDQAPASAAEKTASAAPAVDANVLDDYYADGKLEYGFASLCKMTLPDNLAGKRVLNIGCRRGKGVFKLSSRVGDSGYVFGIDWVPEYVDEARERMDRAWQESGLEQSNMAFELAYPEQLAELGLEDDSFDVVFVNSIINLVYDPTEVLRACYRLLKPGGMIILETTYASGERDPQVVTEARSIGNAIQASPARNALVSQLAETGFREVLYLDEHPVTPSDGALPDKPVPVVETDEPVKFQACVMHVVK